MVSWLDETYFDSIVSRTDGTQTVTLFDHPNSGDVFEIVAWIMKSFVSGINYFPL